jgi:hypothetical protein
VLARHRLVLEQPVEHAPPDLLGVQEVERAHLRLAELQQVVADRVERTQHAVRRRVVADVLHQLRRECDRRIGLRELCDALAAATQLNLHQRPRLCAARDGWRMLQVEHARVRRSPPRASLLCQPRLLCERRRPVKLKDGRPQLDTITPARLQLQHLHAAPPKLLLRTTHY